MPSLLTWTLSLSGLKSLVTIMPGSMTRVGCGSSVLQNVCQSQEVCPINNLRANAGRLTVSVEGPSPSDLPASLFIHSCVLSPPPKLSTVTPGTTRGILRVF